MKNFNLTIYALILTAFFCSCTSAQQRNQEKNPGKNVNITYEWSKIESHGSNQVAVWIEDINGNYICTLFATKFTASGGYVRRPVSLSEWTAKSDWKNASKEEIDAITGATPKSGIQTLYWNGKDKSGKACASGTYVVRMEANILDADKQFFRGEINIGGTDQKTKGEITYSSPNLASGKVLFKNVVVEYK